MMETVWGTPVAQGAGGTPTTIIPIRPTRAKFIRVTQTGTARAGELWAIQQVRVYQAPGQRGIGVEVHEGTRSARRLPPGGRLLLVDRDRALRQPLRFGALCRRACRILLEADGAQVEPAHASLDDGEVFTGARQLLGFR